MPDVDTAPVSAPASAPDAVVTATPDNIPLNTPTAPVPSSSVLDTPTPITSQRTQAIVQPQPTQQPAEPGSFFKHMGNSFAGAVLGALAGKDTVDYVPDLDPKSPNYGRSIPVVTPKPARQQLRTIAQNALMGLAAGSQEKNGWAGAGAGVNAVMQQNRQDDLLKRKQAQEQFEQQQQGMLAKYAYAKFNAANVQNAMEMYNKGLEPDIAETSQIKDAANNANIPTEEMSWQQYLERAKTEPMWAVSHSAHPLGMRPTVDPVSGKPLTDAEGNQQAQPWVLTVQGNRDKNIEVPPIIAAKAQKWGKLGKLPTVASGYEGITPNLSMPQDDFVRLMTDIKANETAASQAKPETKYVDGNEVNRNPISGEITPVTTSSESPKDAATRKAEEALVPQREASARESDAAAAEKLANAAFLAKMSGSTGNGPTSSVMDQAVSQLSPETQTLLKPLDQTTQAALLSVANGDESLTDIFPARPTRFSRTKLTPQEALKYIKQINPSWTKGLNVAVVDLTKSFAGSGKNGQGLNSFNQFIGHAAELYDVASKFKTTRSPWLNTPINKLRKDGAGDSEVVRLMQSLVPVKAEYENLIKSGYAPQKSEVDGMNVITDENSNPGQILTQVMTMMPQALVRLDQLNEQWKTLRHTNYPNLIRPDAKTALQKMGFGSQISKYGSGGNIGPDIFGAGTTQAPSAQAPPVNLLKEGVNTTFGNGQTWTLRNGVQTQVAGQ